ncbi:hypothetical protein [Asticcacaulis machinosus]|uniref:PLAT domain-containing protein n=1 Tax=Asticcacaulis machinosus TaxID=2984211 RepID=A0ABT5HMR6_9CAUL|nr:hypothetical protein [Asticcacaulis machinosus]MDC7677536.1 hypothetical protein [Asticcacaulis machinosus]
MAYINSGEGIMLEVKHSLGEGTHCAFRIDAHYGQFDEQTVAYTVTATVERGDADTISKSLYLKVHTGNGEGGEGDLWVDILDGDVRLLHQPVSELPDVVDVIDFIIPDWVTGDPLITCAIKAGLGAIIRQLMQCHRAHRDAPLRGRIMPVLRCLRDHAAQIGLHALTRFLNCLRRAILGA